MAFTTTATQTELNTLYRTAEDLAIKTRAYAQGDATKDKPGRFTEAEVQAAIDALQAAATAVES